MNKTNNKFNHLFFASLTIYLVTCIILIIYATVSAHDAQIVEPDYEIEEINIQEPEVNTEPEKLEAKIIEASTLVNYQEEKFAELDNPNTDLEQWFKEYKEAVSDYEDRPESIQDVFSDEEKELLFGVVQAEIGDQYSFEQKANVASVIFNRLKSDRFGNTLGEILTSSQFATISNGSYKRVKVSEKTILACEFAYEIKDTTDGCLFFDSNSALRYLFVFNDGAHNFYKLHEERE